MFSRLNRPDRGIPDNLVLRLRDNTLWTATGDCPFPFLGFNFCRVHREKERLRIDKDDRWCFEADNTRQFQILWHWGN